MENIENSKSNIAGDSSIIRNKLKVAKNEGVRKGVITSVIISLLFLIAAGAIAFTLYKQEQNKQLALFNDQQSSYEELITTRDSVINDWLLTFDQIEKDMNLIKQKENIITVTSKDSEFSKSRKEQVLEDISYINTLLENNKQKIASLSAQLKNSGGKIEGFQARIAALETTVKEYETNIAELKETLVHKDFEIGQLNTKMADLEVTITQKDDELLDKTNIMNQAFLTSGTFKELKEKGIVSKEGGFLGLGRKETLARDIDDNLFAKVDVRETMTIPVSSREAKLITSHPSGSYAMVYEGEGENKISHIEIKDPDNFWKISRYAVVEITK